MNKGRLLNVDGGYGLGKDIHLRVIGNGQELFNGKIALDSSHFLKTEYNVDEAQVKAFSTTLQDQLKRDFDAANADVKNKFAKIQEYGAEKRERLQRALPDFRRFTQEYSNEITKLGDELKSDPNVQKIIDTVTPFITEISKFFENMNEIFSKQIEFFTEFFNQIYNDFMTAFNERILPELQKMYEKLQELFKELVENATRAASATIERAAKALKTFQEDFNKISQSFKDMTGGTFETFTQYVTEIIKEVKDLYEQIREQFKTLPGERKIFF